MLGYNIYLHGCLPLFSIYSINNLRRALWQIIIMAYKIWATVCSKTHPTLGLKLMKKWSYWVTQFLRTEKENTMDFQKKP